VGGDLAFEAGGPAAGDCSCTLRAAAVLGKEIVLDQVAVALDQRFVTSWAARVFPLANHAGKVAGVDVAKAGLAADFDGAEQIFRVRVTRAGHFVIAMKSGDVPGNVGRNARQKFGEAAQFVIAVVEAGNEKCNDFEPEPHLVDAADALENGADAAAEFVIVAVVEALEIHFIEIKPRANVVEDLRSAVAVGDEPGDESGGLGFFKNSDRPLAGDERLVVGADDNFRSLRDGIAHKMFG